MLPQPDNYWSACPNLKIMATSRESMGIAGEQTFHVPSMELPENGNDFDIEEYWQVESMKLFKDRVQNVIPNFTPDAVQTKAAARILQPDWMEFR